MESNYEKLFLMLISVAILIMAIALAYGIASGKLSKGCV